MDRKICKRCLLQDMDDNDYYDSVVIYRQTMPEKEALPDAQYNARLDFCRACEDLQNGVCRQCGCYVEMRAAAKKNHCPKKSPLW